MHFAVWNWHFSLGCSVEYVSVCLSSVIRMCMCVDINEIATSWKSAIYCFNSIISCGIAKGPGQTCWEVSESTKLDLGIGQLDIVLFCFVLFCFCFVLFCWQGFSPSSHCECVICYYVWAYLHISQFCIKCSFKWVD